MENVPLPVSNSIVTSSKAFKSTATLRDDNDDGGDGCGGNNNTNNNINNPREVLICNGASDPYVTKSDLIGAKQVFESAGWNTNIINFDNALHNFSNPRTKYDDPDAPFGYDEHATKTSWDATLSLLRKVFDL